MQANRKPNELINESSPYLLQHAYNPVAWLPFTNHAFELAKQKHKPLLISIGYSACHWCHVMEHESFEDETVAAVMNKNFINVKVDREERSDVDAIYMQAVQMMTGHGGWPLNCFVLPNGKAFYGGTYFRKEHWLRILNNLSDLYINDFARVEEYAQKLHEGAEQVNLLVISQEANSDITKDELRGCVKKWKQKFDLENGGMNYAPKFPLPNNYLFLLRYALLENDLEVLNQVELTLNKMACGGIYDQLHGGFARYSTDMIWKVPHFEKMLYDNSQLVSLYCEAYNHTKNKLYQDVVFETLNFIEQNWLHPQGYFYSAYDADSDGVEGKYYVWNELDLRDLLKDNFELFSKYFEINERGYWEEENYILMRNENHLQLLIDFSLSESELKNQIEKCKTILKQEVKSRIMPGLDDKCITSWNAMMCSAYAQAYLSFGEQKWKKIALENVEFILENLIDAENIIYRTFKNGKAKIDAFLEDYVFVAKALMDCYLISSDEKYLIKSKELTEFCLAHFKIEGSSFLYYTSDFAESLASRPIEIHDNVIPASNSQLANNLFLLGNYFQKEEWILLSKNMLSKVQTEMIEQGSSYSNWALLALQIIYPFKQIAIVGNAVDEMLLSLYQNGITNSIFAVSKLESNLPLVKNRFQNSETKIYVCQNYSCHLPVNSVAEALAQLD